MKRNIFETYLGKIESFPLWVRQCICARLCINLQEFCTGTQIAETSKIFALYSPTLTYAGRTELSERKCGWDSNIYNFLQSCEDDFSVADISLNSYFSQEEAAKYFIFCLEQGYLETAPKEILAMASFLSGKTRIGEYFLALGIINETQLEEILAEKVPQKSGTRLLEKGYITEKDLKFVTTLKDEAQRRFILDSAKIPNTMSTVTYTDKELDELSTLRNENKKLKLKLERLLSLVKRDDNEE